MRGKLIFAGLEKDGAKNVLGFRYEDSYKKPIDLFPYHELYVSLIWLSITFR